MAYAQTTIEGGSAVDNIFFIGAVYLSDTPKSCIHFQCIDETICGLEVKAFLTTSHPVTCPERAFWIGQDKIWRRPGAIWLP